MFPEAGGSIIQTGDGPEITVGPGNGGTIGDDGGITAPEGGIVQIGKDPATTVTPPKGGEVKPKEDGTVEVPEGTIVKPGGGGPDITVGLGNGGTVDDDGGVTVEGGGKVTVKGDPDTTITLPSPDGGAVKPNPDGTIPLPGGTVVTPAGKDPITVPDGGTYNPSTDTVTGDITLYAKWTEDAPTHTHSYSSTWSSDVNHHWHECSCGEKSAVAAHMPGEWIIDQEATTTMAGSRHKACTICGYITQTEGIPTTSEGPSGDSPGGGGGWYNPPTTYPVTTPATFPHGKLTFSPTRAEQNATVTITTTP